MTGISRRALSAALLAAPAVARAQAAPAPRTVPSDAEIKAILAQRIDVEHRGVGLVVGIIDKSGRRFISHGVFDSHDPRPVGRDTLFEIGSMTKVFTSLLLTEAVRRGEMASLDDPVAKYLPASVHVPERGGKQITLTDLATHSSGLPRMPTNFAPKDPANPFADYTVEQMYAFLGGYTLTRDIGAQYEYSNLGVGLLGHVLARRAGVDYETLVRQRITAPLGMHDTVITLSPAQQARFALGHQGSEAVPSWDLPTLAGAGALRSTADDMLTFLACELGFKTTALKPSMDAQFAVTRPAGGSMKVALAWHLRNGETPWHNGGTGGFRTFMGFDPKTKIGVVVLANSVAQPGPEDIAFHLLVGSPLYKVEPLKVREAMPPRPEAELEGLVGRYQFLPNFFVTVTRTGQHLFAQLTGQPSAEIFPEGPNDYFYKIVDAQITFTRGPDGRATSMVLHQNGRDQTAPRIAP